MTGNEAYNRALSHLMEKPHDDGAFYDSALGLINEGIVELAPAMQSICRAEGRAFEQGKIASLEDKIPLDESLCNILPLYLASEFLRDDLDNENARIFYNRFTEAKAALGRIAFADVEDIYGGEFDA